MACRGLAVHSGFRRDSAERGSAGPYDDLADAATDRRRDSSASVWLGIGIAGQRRIGEGKAIGIDATTLEANAALRSIVRRDDGESYEDFLKGLAQQSGIATPTREDLARVDRKRKKKGSNEDWVNPHDPDARIAKMKDGCTHLAHNAEHAVDMDTGAVVAVTLQEADLGDTTTVKETLAEAGATVAELIEREARQPTGGEAASESGRDRGSSGGQGISQRASTERDEGGWRARIFPWDHASPRQAHKKDASRHISRAWRQPRGTKTGKHL